MKRVAESTPKIEVQDFDEIRKLYLASVDGHVAGHVVTTPKLDGVKITDLYVAPEARKQGIASSLIDEVKKRNSGKTLVLRARPYGVKGLKLEKLKEMYRKLGFKDESKAEDRLIMKVAAAQLPYRDRAELIARLGNKVMMLEYPDKVIAPYGGGIDPGEEPLRTAAREVFEESGYKIKNVRPAGVPPIITEWTPEMIAANPKLRERAKQFRGSRASYFLGDVANKKRHHLHDMDATTVNTGKPVFMTPEKAIKRLTSIEGLSPARVLEQQQRQAAIDSRVAILKKIVDAKRRRLITGALTKFSAVDTEGLPDLKRFGDVTKLPKAKALRFVIQKHLAERSGTHYDARIGNPELGLLSWATKKEWPGPGGKIMLFQQPVHPYAYGDFQGTLPRGYGKGEVRTHSKGDVTVTAAEPGKLSFTVTRSGVPEKYTMIRRSGAPKSPRTQREARTQGGSWLLVNHTPAEKLAMLEKGLKQGSLIGEVKRRVVHVD